ncbi:metallophosphoesterase [Myxococcus sp. K38C18041901]|uniref:metallophosphoesterase family protein n=1 Tax=Myxococcus guangdongensis TaxID=2906760 RepID=UPI0020A6DD62|nr:metallophosphoesterase [Myxococcus guangdongensis]MCP3063622.1 metallophosphoesterase [Myxococcus guangdongensis]
MADGLTWMHVSDLHFRAGRGRDAANHVAVTRELIADAAAQRDVLGPPDLLIVTGDVAFAGQEEDYNLANKWLTKLLEVLRIAPSQMLVVPGNHDLDRTTVHRNFVMETLHSSLRSNTERLDDALSQPDALLQLATKFRHYVQFKGLKEQELPLSWVSHVRCRSFDQPVVAVGFNSALLSFDDSDAPENLALGRVQLNSALDGVPKNALLLVLQHHPPEWLIDGEVELQMLRPRPHIILCGHTHKQALQASMSAGLGGVLQLNAGAGHTHGNFTSHTYYWGQLGSWGLRLYRRQWSGEHGTFADAPVPRDVPREGDAVVLRGHLPQVLQNWLGVDLQTPSSRSSIVDAIQRIAVEWHEHLDPSLMETMRVHPLSLADETLDYLNTCSEHELDQHAAEEFERYNDVSLPALPLARHEAYLVARYLLQRILRNDAESCRRRPYVYPVHQYLAQLAAELPNEKRECFQSTLVSWLTSRRVYEVARHFAAFQLGMNRVQAAAASLLGAAENVTEVGEVRCYSVLALGMLRSIESAQRLGQLYETERNGEIKKVIAHALMYIGREQKVQQK